MVQRTIDQFYPTYAEAVQAVADLTAEGIDPADISLIESETDARLPRAVSGDGAQNPAVAGATLGAAIGGGLGALAGVQAITIPYTEVLVETGWVLPCFVFAVVFGIIGAIIGTITKFGVTNRSAHTIASGLQQGQQLVMVRVEESQAAAVQGILARKHVTPPAERVVAYDRVAVPATVAQEKAAIHREERRLDYTSE